MLNPLHKNALLSRFLHIESRLNEMEPMLAQSKRPSPLDQHVHDLSPTEAKVVEDYFARIRSTMVNRTAGKRRYVGHPQRGVWRTASH